MVLENSGSLFKGFDKDSGSGNPISDWKWLVENGSEIRAFGTAENTDTVIHTVTTGKTFYVFGIFLGAQNNAAIALPTVSIEFANATIVSANPGKLDGAHEYQTFNLSVPIIVASGTAIEITSNKASCFARGSIIGYEI